MGEQIIIIGGGAIGLSCALECRRRGHQVIVLEADQCGEQASHAAAGMIAPFSENTVVPDAFYDFCVASWRAFPEWVRFVSEQAKRPLDYIVNGSMYAVFHEADIQALQSRMAWQGEQAGRMEIVASPDLLRLEPSLSHEIVAALYCSEEGHVDAPDYVTALMQACITTGVTIVEQTGAVRLEAEEPVVRVLDAQKKVYEGERLVICAGAWLGEWAERLQLQIPVYPIRGQMCAYDGAVAPLAHIIVTSQGYFLSKSGQRLMHGASEDQAGFVSEVTEEGIERLLRWGPKVVPALQGHDAIAAWAGLRPATDDGWPLLGMVDGMERVIVAAGHYRNGILLSPLTAHVVADIIDQSKSSGLSAEILAKFSPGRFTLAQQL